MKSPTIIKAGGKMKIVERDWGIERCYILVNGEQICTPSPFLTNYRKLDWASLKE